MQFQLVLFSIQIRGVCATDAAAALQSEGFFEIGF